MRWALIQSAYVAVKFDPELKIFFERLKQKKGVKKADCCNSKKVAEKGVCSVEEERALRKLWFVVIMAF